MLTFWRAKGARAQNAIKVSGEISRDGAIIIHGLFKNQLIRGMVVRTSPAMIAPIIIANVASGGAINVRKNLAWAVRVNLITVEPAVTICANFVEYSQIVESVVLQGVINAHVTVFAMAVERRRFNAGTGTRPFLATKNDDARLAICYRRQARIDANNVTARN
jgi:hypothetical protein